MDTTDLQILERVQKLETRVTVLEGWRASLKNDLQNVATHSIEVDKKCSEIQEYLDQRRDERKRLQSLVYDLKKWFMVLVVGWALMTFLDGARQGILEWLKTSVSGQRAP